MVLSGPGTLRTLVVPDEPSWLMWGVDPVGRGMEATFDPAATEAVLRPAHLPQPLAGVVDRWLQGRDLRLITLPSPLSANSPDAVLPAAAPSHAREEGDMAEMDDMMAIVGEPSADGLVMEPLEVHVGPLGSALPGGLLVEATLDGEQVTEGHLTSLLVASPANADPAAPLTARVALGGGAHRSASSRVALAAVEAERALSHLAWLRSLGRLLGWHAGVRLTRQAAMELLPIRSQLLAALVAGHWPTGSGLELRGARRATDELFDRVQHDRLVRRRLSGLAPVSAQQAHDQGLRGPNARASGLDDDARRGSVAYELVDFRAAVTARDGDALARTAVRCEEAAQSLRLLARLADTRADLPALGQVEAARGPMELFDRGGHRAVRTLGTEEARLAAQDAMTGLGWSDALVAVCSFDLSAWTQPA